MKLKSVTAWIVTEYGHEYDKAIVACASRALGERELARICKNSEPSPLRLGYRLDQVPLLYAES